MLNFLGAGLLSIAFVMVFAVMDRLTDRRR